MYICDGCGECCKNVGRLVAHGDLDRGDGVCKNFDLEKNVCRVYKDRPLECRVDDYYKEFIHQYLSEEDYYNYAEKVCEILKDEVKENVE